MTKKTIIVLVLFAVLAGGAGYLLFTGPRMRQQPYIRAYQAQLPPVPAGIVPVEDWPPQPATQPAANPLAASPENLRRGKVYYEYYCQCCHGLGGAGDGPVGQSYLPVPADLRSSRVQSYDDAQLLRFMLEGAGHWPVLERVVPPEHRRYLVLHVRQLGQQ